MQEKTRPLHERVVYDAIKELYVYEETVKGATQYQEIREAKQHFKKTVSTSLKQPGALDYLKQHDGKAFEKIQEVMKDQERQRTKDYGEMDL